MLEKSEGRNISMFPSKIKGKKLVGQNYPTNQGCLYVCFGGVGSTKSNDALMAFLGVQNFRAINGLLNPMAEVFSTNH